MVNIKAITEDVEKMMEDIEAVNGNVFFIPTEVKNNFEEPPENFGEFWVNWFLRWIWLR